MKIITLNIWGGRAGKENLLSFFAAHSDADIFCLQEVWSAPYNHLGGVKAGGTPLDFSKIMSHGLQDIGHVLPEHAAYFRPLFENNYGLLIFVRKTIPVLFEDDLYVYKHKGYVGEHDIGDHGRSIQHITMETPSGPLTVINFHGLWNGHGKSDTPERIAQSENILAFVQTLKNPFVLCGDFNLTPDTQSLQAFETFGMRNLIKEYGITSTRTSFYTKPERFADYVFTDPAIPIKNFQVLPEEVSDHTPLYLEI